MKCTVAQQDILVKNREAVFTEMKKYPGVMNVGVGLKEINGKLTSVICYRIYVDKKKPAHLLKKNALVPPAVHGFPTDVIQLGEIEEIADTAKYRPLKGGVQIKTDRFKEDDARGVGTLGCLAIVNDGSNKIVGLTNEHVVRLNAEEGTAVGREVGQPRKVICCCCCTYNVVGKVLNAQKNATVDCAIIDLDSDIAGEIQTADTAGEIQEIGKIKGTATAVLGDTVKKRGATTGITTGTITDVAFDGTQILIAPTAPATKFADFGDSGSIVLDNNNNVIALLWAVKRDGRTDGVATPIDAVLTALNIKLQTPPPITGNITVHPTDTKTHIIPSVLPPASNPRPHFVTAKGTGDIILKVNFDTPVDNDKISWVSSDIDADITFPAVGTDNSTAKISRNPANGLRTGVYVLADGQLVTQITVWVVWSVGSVTAQRPIVPTITPTVVSVTGGYDFDFTIQPADIIPDTPTDDVPNLKGPKTTSPPNVPAGDTNVYQQGEDLSGGVINKWDITRRLKQKVINPAGVALPGDVKFNTTFLNFPSDLVVGNDDKGVSDETNDPYANAKKITSVDDPTQPIQHTSGAVNDLVEYRVHFQEFARLELDGHWYNISDPTLWRIHIKFKKASEAADNTDYNADGDKTDTLWINNGSDIALDNAGF